MKDANKIPVIIDTDPGDDDASAILWVLACGKFDVKALTISNGNVGVDKCVVNALRTLEIAGRTDIPVYVGSYRPLVRPSVEASWVHGKDGFGDLGFPLPKTNPAPGHAAVEMARIVRESAEPVTILSICPMTNIALAILLDPKFVDNVKQILFMGGAVRVTGNQSPRASYNVAVDPEAAKVVYNSGAEVVQLGLDICDKVSETAADLAMVEKAGTPVTDFLIKLLSFRREKAKKPIYDEKGVLVGYLKVEDQVDIPERKGGGVGLNDLAAAGYLVNPEWFKTMHAAMDVETQGLCTGETIVDYKGLWGRKPNARFAYDVDGKALVAQWITDMTGFKS